MSLLDKVTISDLDADQRVLAECIGITAYKKLLKNYAGSFVYVRKPATITKNERNTRIRKEFTGCNYTQLAKKFGLSAVTIRRIVSESPPGTDERDSDHR